MSFATLIAAGPLRRGTRNRDAVTELQKLLNRLNARLEVDGDFGGNTQDAVIAFQQQHGLGADGVVGPLTAQALEMAAANPGQQIKAEARTDFSGGPVWWQWALHEIGVEEIPGARQNPRILEYRSIAKCPSSKSEEDLPWCAIFANAALEANGIAGTRSAGSRSFEHDRNFVRLPNPTLGCLVTFWRISPRDGRGHVGFYRGETATRIYALSGNAADAVSVAPFAKQSASFAFSGYWWPGNVPQPLQLAAIPIRAGEPLAQVSVV
jgi:uncharacterized protein (TIGR02594 family)